MSTFARKLARRKALRINFQKKLEEANLCLKDSNCSRAKIMGLKNEQSNELSTIDDEIINILEPENVEADVFESMKIAELYHEIEAELTLKLEELKINGTDKSSENPNSFSVSSKLPKIELPVFSGDLLKWQGFWDQFDISIHQNESISDIDRFNYLKKYLSGPALGTISGLTFSSANYKEAITILTERYGNHQVLISVHIDSLLKMKKVKNMENLNGLRKLYTNVENCVHNLKILKVETSTYGCLFIPILKKKLPDELLVIISRKFAGNVWVLDELLKHFLEELQAKESCVSYLKNQHTESEKSKHGFTASGFYSENRELKSQKSRCVYCLGEDHPPSRCSEVTNINSRIDVSRKFSKCFVCLKSGHLAKNCSSKYVCHKCNQRHHISICTKTRTRTKTALLLVWVCLGGFYSKVRRQNFFS